MRFEYYTRALVVFVFLFSLVIYLLTPLLLNRKPPLARDSEYCGYVVSYPYKSAKFFYFYLKNNDGRFLVKTTQYIELSLYDYICLKGDVSEINSCDYFGNFSWKKYMNLKNIFWEINSYEIRRIRSSNIFFSIASTIRYRFKKMVEKNFSRNLYSVIEGLVLGEKEDLSADFKDAVNRCGITHLMVASGSNISYFMSFCFFVVGFFPFPRRLKYFISMIFGFLYVLIIGFDPPVTRGYMMIVCGFLIYFLRRNTDPFNSVVLVFTVMLLNQPLYIYDPSFIMSFLCVYGIVVGFMNWGWIFEKFDLIKFKSSDGRLFVFLKMTLRRSIRAIVSIFLMTIFSQMMLFPYVSTHFYRFSLVSYLSNLILIPFSSAVMSVSVLWSFLRFFTDLTFANTLVELSVNGFINMVYYFSSFKYSMIYFSLPNPVSVISITLLILTLLHLPIFDFSKPWSKLWFSFVFIFLIFSFSIRTPVSDDINLKAKHKDVWYIERNGEYFIVDPILDADKIINAVYASRRNRVDYIVISSYKTFRKKTLLKLIETFKVKKVIMPMWICEKDIPADCIFGGEERNGFYAEFYDNYGYHNIYSRLRFCFKDRCF